MEMINRYKFKPGIKNVRISLECYADYMHDIVQTIREPLLALDSNLRVTIANKSFYKTFRVRRNETENQLIYELGNGQWNIPKLLELLRTVLVKKMGFENYEMEHSFPHIGTKIMLLDAAHIYHEIDATQTVLLSIEDVTAEREAEGILKKLNADLEKRGQQLEQTNEEIKQLLRVKTDFAARVSHELRTPLSAIKESINIVYKGSPAAMEEQKVFLEMAQRNIERLGRLVDNILDFSKLEAGKRNFSMVKGSINEMIHDAADLYGILAAQKGLKINCELQLGIPEMSFDYDAVFQVLTNLLSNALKFTENGEIVVSSQLQADAVVISVHDTGIGIEKKDLKRLFQPFEQIVSAEGKRTEGAGLGLNISRQIVEQHQGKMWADSIIGQGTCLQFSLPLLQKGVIARESCIAP